MSDVFTFNKRPFLNDEKRFYDMIFGKDEESLRDYLNNCHLSGSQNAKKHFALYMRTGHTSHLLAYLSCAENGKALLNQRDDILENSLLIWAAYHNKPEDVYLLLQKGINVEYRNARGYNAMVYAIQNANPEIVRYLLGNNGKLNPNGFISDGASETYLHFALRLLVDRPEMMEVVNVLREFGASFPTNCF